MKGMAQFRSDGEDFLINDGNIADEFNISAAYKKGDFVYYEGSLYEFTANHAAGAWNSSHVRIRFIAPVAEDLMKASARTGEAMEYKNLFDITAERNTLTGYYSTADGKTFVSSNEYGITDFIPIVPGHRYITKNPECDINMYSGEDLNSFVGAGGSAYTNMGYLVPVSAANYARFIFKIKDYNEFYVYDLTDGEVISVKRNNLSSLMDQWNYFDKNAVGNHFDGYYNTSGSFIQSSTYGQTDFIKIEPGHRYASPQTDLFVNFYASVASETPTQTVSSSVFNKYKFVTAPSSGVSYMKMEFALDKVDDFYVYDLDETDRSHNKLNKSIVEWLFEKVNLFTDRNAITEDGYYDENGQFQSYFGIFQTGFIKIKAGHRYTSTRNNSLVLFYKTENNADVVGKTSSIDFQHKGYAQAPANAEYAKFCTDLSYLDYYKVYDEDNDDPKKIDRKWIDGSEGVYEYNINQFINKKWVSFGDSITYRNTWQPTVADLLGLDHTNCGLGSSAVSGPTIMTDKYSFWMNVRLNEVKAANPDIITILGGANDIVQSGLTIGTENEFKYPAPSNAAASEGAEAYSDTGTYAVGDYCTKDSIRYECITAIASGEAWNADHWKAVKNVDSFIGAYSYIIENLLAWKRTVSIVILGTTWGENNGQGYAHGINYSDLSEACKTVAQYYGIPFVDLHGLLGYNKFTMGTGENAVYSNDQLHPNAEGSKQLSKVVLNAFVNLVTVH